MENPTRDQSQVDRLGEALYFCRILRILVSNRVDLSVSGSGVKVCLHEGLYIGILP